MDDKIKNTSKPGVAYYHLPGLFEFYGLYRMFLPLFYHHREYFYNWCAIGSIYGALGDCIWGGGRTSFGVQAPEDVMDLMRMSGYYEVNCQKDYAGNDRVVYGHR